MVSMNIFSKNKAFCDSISIQGFSHKKINKECQDYSVSWVGKDYCGIIVCDGHGGDKYIRSDIGSRLACEIGKKNISTFMEKFVFSDSLKIDSALEQLEKSIVSGWYQAVETDYSINPITDDERFSVLSDSEQGSLVKNPVKAYGSTFIASVKTKDFCFVLKLGDGNAIFFYSDGSNEMPKELDDEDCQFNITTSLCNNDALLSFHHCFRKFSPEKNITGIMLTSDGVINCYKTKESYVSFMQNIYFGYGEDGVELARKDLLPVLEKLSEKGSGDDLSVAIIRDPISDEELEFIAKKRETFEEKRKMKKTQKDTTNNENEILIIDSVPKIDMDIERRIRRRYTTLLQDFFDFFGK